jgi:signal recognition particle receptor subunit beta
MVFFNYSTMQMTAKVVYYGPGLCGKTTNLQYIYGHTATDSRGEMVSLETETDRTLFFDLLPIDVGTIGGFSTRIQLYTVPGQVFYNTTRKLVLKGVDGVVFVADSQRPMVQANADSLKNLEENLAEMGLTLDAIPVVLQYNKRDLPDVVPVEELNRVLNQRAFPHFEASALSGQGVFETLKGISKQTLLSLKRRLTKMGEGTGRPVAPLRAPAGAAAGATSPPAAAPRPRPTPPPPAAQTRPATGALTGAAPAAPRGGARGKSSKLDVLAELEKIRKQALTEPRPEGTPRSGAHAQVAPPPAASSAPAPRPAVPPPAAASGPQPRVAPAPSDAAVRSGSHPRPLVPAAAEGNGEIHRAVELTLKRSELRRARRFLLDLRVEDADARVVDAIRNLPIDINDPAGLDKLLLHLKVALNSKD